MGNGSQGITGERIPKNLLVGKPSQTRTSWETPPKLGGQVLGRDPVPNLGVLSQVFFGGKPSQENKVGKPSQGKNLGKPSQITDLKTDSQTKQYIINKPTLTLSNPIPHPSKNKPLMVPLWAPPPIHKKEKNV